MDPLVIALEIFYGCLIVVTVVGNILVIEAVRRNVPLRTISNIPITSLAVADLLTGLINIPTYMYCITQPLYLRTKTFQMVQYSFDIYFSIASILHLAVISLDRCYAVSCPVKRLTLQKGTIVKILFMLWIIAFIPVGLFIGDVKFTVAIVAGVFFLLPLLIMIASYTILAITAMMSWGKMDAHCDIKRKTKKELRLAKTLCIIIVLFVAAWLPFFVVLIMFHYPKHFTINLTRSSLALLAYFIKILHHSNSAVNPIVYAFRQKEFYKAFKVLLGCHRWSRRDSVTRTSTLQTSRSERRQSPEKIKMITANHTQENGQET